MKDNWDKIKLEALCFKISDGLHGTPSYTNNGEIYFINGNNLKNGTIIITEDTKKVTSETLKENYIQLNENSLLLSINGTLGDMAFYSGEKIMLGKSAAYLNFKTDINKFFYYYFQLKGVQEYFYNVATGSTIKNLSLKSIQEFEVPFPEKQEYQKIASILSALDDEIELNNQINAELEAMAQTLYDYWFVQFDFPFDFTQGKPDKNGKPYKSSGGKMVYNKKLKRKIPEGWSNGTLREVANLVRGVSYTKKDILPKKNESSIKILRATNITGNKIDVENCVLVDKEFANEEQILNQYDILLTMSSGSTNHIGKNGFYYLDEKVSFGAFCAKLVPSENYKFYLYSYMQSHYLKQTIKNQCLGTNINNLNSSMVNGFKIIKPPKDILIKFNNKIKSLFDKIANNTKQNQELAALRDWLLPMLMNGQVTSASSATENGNKDYKTETTYAQAAEEGEEYHKRN